MRVDVKKFLFVGVIQDKKPFFAAAQHLGRIHFIERPGKKLVVEPQNNVSRAIKVVRSLPPIEQEDFEDYSVGDQIADKINDLNEELEAAKEEIRLLGLEISRVGIFGDYNLDDIAYIEREGNVHFRYFAAKSVHREIEEPLQEGLIYVGSEFGLDYFVALDDGTQNFSGLIELQIEKPLGALKKRLKEAELERKQIEKKLHEQARFNRYLHHFYLFKLNTFILEMTRDEAVLELEDNLFSIQAWVPVDHVEEVFQLCANHDVHVEEIAISPEEVMPTFLENEGVARIGEDIIQIYDTPSYQDKDPSLWVLFAFALFFAMIVGDAGYGSVYLGLALYIGYKYPKLSGGSLRALKMVKILGIACIIWGVLTNAFFGIDLHPDNPIRKLSLMHWLAVKKADYHLHHKDELYKNWLAHYPKLDKAKTGQEVILYAVEKKESGSVSYRLLEELSRGIMLELALFVGAIHIILSLLRNMRRNWGALGWIFAIIGGYLYFSHYLGAVSIPFYVFGIPFEKGAIEGKYMLYGGISWALFFSLVNHKLLGILDLMNAVQIFADIMSYLRLYALGLAGAIVGITINEMSETLPFVIAVLLIIPAHIINMILGIVSGVIHGLRLNFLEWYHYSFEGGGKMFRPLKFLDID